MAQALASDAPLFAYTCINLYTYIQVLEEMEQEKVPYDDMTHTIIVDSMIVKRHAKEAIAYTLQLKEDKIRSALQQAQAQRHTRVSAYLRAYLQLKEDKSRSAQRPSLWQEQARIHTLVNAHLQLKQDKIKSAQPPSLQQDEAQGHTLVSVHLQLKKD